MPADLDAAEQVRLGARHLEQAQRIECRLGAENFRVRLEAHLGAAAVVDLAELLQAALRLAALESLRVELAAARDLDLHALRQRIRDRHADAVQAARGAVDLGIELAARVQRGHDHFERGLVLELRMRIDRDAAAVVGHGDEAVGFDLDLDEMRHGRRAPRPWRCRSPRRTGDAAPSRRCRRYTCRAAGAPARAPPAPRYGARCSRPRRRPPARELRRSGLAAAGRARAPAGRTGRGGGFFRCFCLCGSSQPRNESIRSTMPRPWLNRDRRRYVVRGWYWRVGQAKSATPARRNRPPNVRETGRLREHRLSNS